MLLNELFFLNSNRYFERTYSSVLKMSSSVIVICCRSTGIFLLHCKCVTMFGRPRLLICKIFCCWKAISIDLHQMFWLPDRMWKSEIFNRFQIVSFNYELMKFSDAQHIMGSSAQTVAVDEYPTLSNGWVSDYVDMCGRKWNEITVIDSIESTY